MGRKKFAEAITFQIFCYIIGAIVAAFLSKHGIVLGKELSIFPAIAVAFLVVILIIEVVSVFKISDSTVHTVFTAVALLASYLTSDDFTAFMAEFGFGANYFALSVVHYAAFHAVMLSNLYFMDYTYGFGVKRAAWAALLACVAADCALYGVLGAFSLQYIAFFAWLPVCVYIVARAYIKVAKNKNYNRIFFLTTTIMCAEAGMQTVEEINGAGLLFSGVSGFETAYMMFIICLFGVVYISFIFVTEKNSVMADEYRLQAELMKTRVLQQQINPHYIYNSLTVVKEMYHQDCESGDNAINLFAKHLRASVIGMTADLIPFEDEIENIRNYLGFENLTRVKPVEVLFNIEYSDFRVPPLSLQVFVENAVKHGKVGEKSDGLIEISSFEQGDEILVGVTDNGVGFDPDKIGDKSCGINNSHARISLLLGGKVEIISSVGNGTQVIITLDKRAAASVGQK